MKLKAYKHTYNNYTFYADSDEDMMSKVTQLVIIAQDRNFIKKRLLAEQDDSKKKDLEIELQCAINAYTELRNELESPYRKE